MGSACPPWAVLAVLWILSLTAAAVHELPCDDFLFRPVINGPRSMRCSAARSPQPAGKLGAAGRWEMLPRVGYLLRDLRAGVFLSAAGKVVSLVLIS